MLAIAPRQPRAGFARSASASAVRSPSSGPRRAQTRLVVDDAHFRQPSGRRAARRDPRQAAEDDARRRARTRGRCQPLDLADVELREAAYRVLQLPAVADKTFLVTIGDRTVGGLCARDPMVGPWQVPVADVAVTLMDFDGLRRRSDGDGRAHAARADRRAGVRTHGRGRGAHQHRGRAGRRRFATSSCRRTGWRPPDIPARTRRCTTPCAPSRSILRGARRRDPGRQGLDVDAHDAGTTPAASSAVTAPVSLIVSAFAPVDDARKTLTPLLRLDEGDTALVLLDAGGGKRRLGGSALAQVYGQLGDDAPDLDDPARLAALFRRSSSAQRDRRLLAYHDVADGGLFATLREMAFASRCGLEIALDAHRRDAAGGAVRRGDRRRRAGPERRRRGAARRRSRGRAARLRGRRRRYAARSHPHSHASMASCSTNRASSCTAHGRRRRTRCSGCATIPRPPTQEYDAPRRRGRAGDARRLTFDPAEDIAAPFIATGVRPRDRDPARAGRQRPGRDGRSVRPRRLRRVRRAHERHLAVHGVRSRDFQGIVAWRRVLVRRRARRRRGLGEVDPASTRARATSSQRSSRAGDTFALGRVQRLPDDEQPARADSGCRALAALRAQSLRAVRGAPRAARGRALAVAVLRRHGGQPHSGCHRARRGLRGVPRCRAARRRRNRSSRCASSTTAGGPTERYPFNPNGSPQGIAGLTTRGWPLHDPDAASRARVPHRADVVASAAMGRGLAVDADVPQRARMA